MQPDKLALVSTNASPEEMILRNFIATIGRKRYEQWFQNRTQIWIEGDELVVAVSTQFLVNWISQNFRTGLLGAARPVIGEAASVRFEVRVAVPTHANGDSAQVSLACERSENSGVSNALASTVSSTSTTPRRKSIRVDASEPAAAVDLKNGEFPSPRGASVGGAAESAIPNSNNSDNCRESLRQMCRETHVAHSAPQPVSLKLAVAAATNAVQVANPTFANSSKRPQDLAGDRAVCREADSGQKPLGRNSPRSQQRAMSPVEAPTSTEISVARTVVEKRVIEPAIVEQTTKLIADKPVASVARITKESPLTIGKVKPVTEPPRNQRRYADLLDLVEGSCNEFALSAARQVCQAPGVQFTSLFVHGPVGVGKTHVLEGIHRELKQRFPTRQVVYLTAEAFANFFTQALRDQKLPSFRQKFRSIDVLIVDDIDFLDGKRGMQEEFLFTVQQLEAHGRVVVVAAHGHPRLLTKMSDELRTRFLAGMVCRIDAPDVATRRRIIENKAFRAGVELGADVVQFVADRFRNNVRELEGAFNTLLAHQRMLNRRLSLTAVRNALADLERDCIRVVRMEDIDHAVCNMFGITEEELKSTKRQQSISQPRMLAMYLARKHTRAAYTEIGQHFGGRNHSTVMAAEKKIRASLTEESPMIIRTQTWRIGDLIESLEQQLQAS